MHSFGDYDWVAWFGLAALLGIVEVTTLDLVFAMLAVARPLALKHLRTPVAIRTGTAALIGQRGLVLEAVGAESGLVKLKGEVWSARSFDPHHTIEAGRHVDVVQIDGATAVVYESEI